MPRLYYVSVINGQRRAFLAGPYATHAEALAQVETVRQRAYEIDPYSHFYEFGTASAEASLKTRFGALSHA